VKRAVVARVLGLGVVWSLAAPAAPPAVPAAPKVLDSFDDTAPWKLVVSDQVSGSLRSVAGANGGRALCVDYDFHEVSVYLSIRR